MTVLKHHGVKGQKWGIRRDSRRPGGADGKEESVKVDDKRGKVRKKLDSMKRERQWRQVLREVDKMNTKDIRKISNRIGLENDMKAQSKSKMSTKKDKEDYLRREFMSDAELSRKVARLKAKNTLHDKINDASKEQREFGIKVAQVSASLGVKYALNRGRITPKDIFNSGWEMAKTPKESADNAQKEVSKRIATRNPQAADVFNYAVNKYAKPKSKS